MSEVLVALGGNIRPRRPRLLAALDALDALPRTRVLRRSALHETAPVDAPPGSGPFLNGACLLRTGLAPLALLAELQRLEREAGRIRAAPNGPRTLDLDLVLYDDLVLSTPDLELPHPRAHRRDFVLRPAAEVAPDMRHPLLGASVAELAAAVARDREAPVA